MSIPKQVEEAADLAEQLFEKMNEAPVQQDVDTPDSGEVDEQQEAEPEVDYEAKAREYEQKWKSLQGMYNSSQDEIRAYKQLIIEKAQAAQQQPEQQVEKQQKNERIAKFEEEYGEEYVETLRELNRIEVERLLAEKVAPVESKIASVEDTQIRVAQDNFKNYLSNAVKGDWNALWNGDDPKFIEFLGQPDPSGLYTYGDLAQMYNNSWDADKLAKIFNTYLDSKAPQKPPAANPSRDAMVAPSRSNAHSSPSIDNPRVWTSASIEEFKVNDRKGKYDAETSMAMWTDLLSAINEGRIRG